MSDAPDYTDDELARFALSDHRPNAYQDTDPESPTFGKLVLRASTLRSCTRALAAAALDLPGSDAPENIRGRMDESTLLEQALTERLAAGEYQWHPVGGGSDNIGTVQMAMMKPGDISAYRGMGPGVSWIREDAHEFRAHIGCGPGTVIAGGIDNIGVIHTRPVNIPFIPEHVKYVVIEEKNLGEQLFNQFLKGGLQAMPQYEWQSNIYYAAARSMAVHPEQIMLMFAVGEKLYDEYDRSGLKPGSRGKGKGVGVPTIGRVVVQVIHEPTVSLGVIKARGMEIARVVRQAMDEGLPERCDRNDYPCPYFNLHDDDSKAVGVDGKAKSRKVVDVSEIPDKKLAAETEFILAEYAKAQAMEKEAKALKDDVKGRLNDIVREIAGPGGALKHGALTAGNIDTEDVVKWVDLDDEEKKRGQRRSVTKGKNYVTVTEAKDGEA